MTKKYFKRLLKKRIHPINWRVLLKTHILFFGIGFLLFHTLHFLALEFYNFKEVAIEDIDFSDLYYQNQDTPKYGLDSIIIINSGSIPIEEKVGMRKNLNRLLHIIDTTDCKPAKIGVDLEYNASGDKDVDTKLENTFKEKNCVIAESKQNGCIFNSPKKGYVNFSDEDSKAIRMYYNYFVIDKDTINSFARECSNRINHTKKEFHLKYYCKDKGFYNRLDPENEEETVFAFPAVEGSTILANTVALDTLKKLFKDKIVLIGHLGQGSMNNPDDINDKHKTPTDFDFIRKSKIMPGVVIHANAIKQLQLHESIYCVNGVFYVFILYLITLYFFIAFILIERLASPFVQLFTELAFLMLSMLLIHYGSVKLLCHFIHLNTVYIAITLLFLIELKSFFMEYYSKNSEHQHSPKKNKHKS
jgi:CHASE2 domain-containing sensor protein